MKVTISFDGTKIVVPCGDGDISVRELTNLAVTRYKKAIGKPNNYWVHVANLKSCFEGGMLDPDDLICDVCDDREQLVAIFEEQSRSGLPGDHFGDGMSSEDSSDSKDPTSKSGSSASYDNNNALNNQCRRGSEPNLAKRQDKSGPIIINNNNNPTPVAAGTVQAAVANFNAITQTKTSKPHLNNDFSMYGSVGRSFSSQLLSKHSATSPGGITQPDFFLRPSPNGNSMERGRSSLRMTMLPGGGGPTAGGGNRGEEGLKVFNFYDRDYDSENLDSLNFDSKCSLNVMRRREPLGASGNRPEKPKSPVFREVPVSDSPSTIEVVIPNENGPLGIHVVPCDDDGRLVVQGIEPGGRVDRDGQLAVGDEIISINGMSLTPSSFTRAQEIFKEALSAKELRLGVIKGGTNVSISGREEMAVEGGDDKENKRDAANHQKMAKFFDASTSTTGTLTKMAAGTKITTAVNANNTRKIGKVIRIELLKGPLGLGFSITTRDNAPGGNTPIYIKNILPKGAAIEEGTLKPGDRLLEVNGVSVDGMSQSEVVTLLRNAPQDSTVNLVVSRHLVTPSIASPSKAEEEKDIKSLGNKKLQFRELEPELEENRRNEQHEEILKQTDTRVTSSTSPAMSSSGDDGGSSTTTTTAMTMMDEFQFPWKQREILTFDIPVHDSERAGLGVSVKGKTSTSKDGTVVDLGIFVKSVLHGGAASRDGRLKTNDQLVNINGISLLGKHNPAAMETLRKAMHEEGPVPGIISLTVARRRYEDLDQLGSMSSAATSLSQGNSSSNSGSFQPRQRDGSDRRDSLSSSSDDAIREYRVTHQPPPPPPVPPVQLRPQQFAPFPPSGFKLPGPPAMPPQSSSSSLVTSSLKHVRNPVVDRLMGKESQSAGLVPSNLRNDSYYMATHQDTWNGGIPMSSQQLSNQLSLQRHHQHATSTMHPSDSGEGVIMIEQDDFSKAHQDDPMEDIEDDNRTTTTHESLTSLVEVFPGFSRDRPGRQSMSEKRHATLDAKSTDTYQKRKKAREEKLAAKDKENNKLLFKKSASLESLQMIGAKSFLSAEEREAMRNAYIRANSVRVARNRGCNESFRAAVDRSYERDFPTDNNHDFAIEDLDDDNDDCFDPAAMDPLDKEPEVVMRRSKSERDTPSRKKNRNSKLFRGLGTMFRIGNKPSVSSTDQAATRRSKSSSSANRKSLPGPMPETSVEEVAPLPGPPSRSASGTLNAPTMDYRQNFVLSKSRSGDLATGVATAPSRQQHQQHQKRQAPPPPPFMTQHMRGPAPPNHVQHMRRPGEMYAYEYFPSAMMRPGSRVGIADPAQLSTESADYDVIQRLQHRGSDSSSQQQQQQQPQQHMRHGRDYNPVYDQVYGTTTFHGGRAYHSGLPPHHGVHLGSHGLAQVHLRSGSNLSNGSSSHNNNNLNTSGGSAGSASSAGRPPRPKSNYYEYELYSSGHHHQHHPHQFHPSNFQQQQQQLHFQYQQQQQQQQQSKQQGHPTHRGMYLPNN